MKHGQYPQKTAETRVGRLPLKVISKFAVAAIACLATFVQAYSADSVPAPQPISANVSYGPEMEEAAYPYPVKDFAFNSQKQRLHMAYMDVHPEHANGQTAVLLHGKNFCAASWVDTIREMTDAGYRVIAVDEIGFCKSSKPAQYQHSFQQLATNTQNLLESIGVNQFTLVGHSTGGMLAIRYALMYPTQVSKLVLVDPVGLEDWKAKGVPAQTVDQWYMKDLKTTDSGLRKYEQSVYYDGKWSDRYEPWVQMLAGLYRGPGKETVAWNSALIFDMIYTQPVVYEFGNLQPDTLLVIGDKDTTAIGIDVSPAEVRARIGHYPELGRAAVAAMPHATLVEFPDMGHAPQIQDPKAFNQAMLKWLSQK